MCNIQQLLCNQQLLFMFIVVARAATDSLTNQWSAVVTLQKWVSSMQWKHAFSLTHSTTYAVQMLYLLPRITLKSQGIKYNGLDSSWEKAEETLFHSSKSHLGNAGYSR